MYSSPWGQPRRQNAPGIPRVFPSDDRTDADANQERVLLLERDDNLERASRKRRAFLHKLHLEALRRQFSQGNVISLLYPTVAMNGLTQQDVIRALRVMGFGPSDIDAIKLNDFRTNQAEVMFKDDDEIDVTDMEKKIKDAGKRGKVKNTARIANAVQCHDQLSVNKIVMNAGSQLSVL